MDVAALLRRAEEVRAQLRDFELERYGAEWSVEDLVLGLMTDVGDLAAIVQRLEGKRPGSDKDPLGELQHELADCFWVLLVLSSRYGVDLGAAFLQTMHDIEGWLAAQSLSEPGDDPAGGQAVEAGHDVVRGDAYGTW